ncbi:unnamed protein product [Cunninghamella echinulata]
MTILTWTQIVSRGLELKVPKTNNGREIAMQRRAMEKIKVYEHPELQDQLRIHRAEVILQQALHSNDVLFEIPYCTHYRDAYKLIEDTCGRVLGFRCINKPKENNTKQNLLIEAKFANETDRKEAISKGITIDGIVHRSTPCMENANDMPEMTRVYISGVPPEEEDKYQDMLIQSLNCYGQVAQMLLLKDNRYFEGEISVLLNRSSKTGSYELLQRMLFLSAWDRYLPAYFKGAPKVCNHCRKTGHIKKECPALADLKCYNCNGKGHIARNCRKFYTQDKEKSFNEEIDRYIVDTKEFKETKIIEIKEKRKIKDSNNSSNTENVIDYEKTKEGQRTVITNIEKKKSIKEEKVEDTKSTNVMVINKEENFVDDLNNNSSSKNKANSFDKLASSEDTIEFIKI